jgi:hypothetical protein
MEKEVHEGIAQLWTDDAGWKSWVIVTEPEVGLELGAIAEVSRWEGKKIRVTIEEIT